MSENLSKHFYLENVEDWEKKSAQKRFSDKALEIKIVERGIVLPARQKEGTWEGGVCDSNFNFIAGYARAIPPEKTSKANMWASVESAYIVDKKELIELDEDVIFCGFLLGHFGHFFMECWSRLWYVIQNPKLKSKILFIRQTYKPYFEDFFKLMGLDLKRIIYVNKPMQCRSVTVPEQAQYLADFFTKEYLLPYKEITSRVKPGKIKKLYLTRRNFDERYLEKINSSNENTLIKTVCFNEKYFEDFFTARGFKVIAPENLSVEEQISLVTGADEIATTLGTLSNWAIFCKPCVKFIILNRTNNGSIDFQFIVNEAIKFKDCYIVDASKNFMYAKHVQSVLLLGSNKYWKAFVADYFGEHIKEDDDNFYLEEVLNKYVEIWYKKYADSEEKIIDSLKNMCNRIVALESQISHDRPLITCQTHIAKKGWGVHKSENQLSNPPEQKLDIQAIRINFTRPFHEIYYSVYYNDKEGWSQEVTAGQMAGTTGQRKSITGIKIRLDEAGAKDFDILYRVHKFDGGWTSWAKNGEELLSSGVKLNSIQIKLADKSKARLTTSSMS